MRCHHCFRLTREAVCHRCGLPAMLPTADELRADHETALLTALADQDVEADEALWDDLCLALLSVGAPAGDDRFASVALADMPPEKQCVFGLYAARRRGDEAQAAAHFVVALEQSEGPVRVGPATFEGHDVDEAVVEVWLQMHDSAYRLGTLDREHIRWTSCHIADLPPPTPRDWQIWTDGIRRTRAAIDALVDAQAGPASSSGDTGFRTLWKDFQHALGEERDGLAAPAEQNELLTVLDQRDRAALRALESPRRVSGLVDASRNDLRVRADALRQERVREVDLQAREAFGGAFTDGGLEGVSSMREELRRETASTHAEQRKALDVQSRLLRGSQEALNASLAELERRAASLLWPLTPRALFDDARDQTEMVVERAREVAMIEQTDAYLKSVSPSLEAAADEIAADLAARKTLLETWQRGYRNLATTLHLDDASLVLEDAATLRRWLRDAPATTDGLCEVLAKMRVRERERALVTV